MIDIGSAIIRLDGFPADEAEEIRRCLTALYCVREGEQPLDREFGINYEFLDKPVNIAKNMFALEVIEKTKKYEKRVSVKKVEYAFEDGRMIPVIFCERGDDALG